tara:strand:+ start:2437 stop:2895 length:459 start_codon:yes stop_codon:yes gene_type:complete
MSDVNFLNALVTKLRTDTGAGSLVTLAGGASNISRTPVPESVNPPFVGVRVVVSTPLAKEATGWKTYSIEILAAQVKEINAIKLADRVQYLFDDSDVGATNRSFYNFTDSACTVRSTRWERRLQRVKNENENVTYWDDSNVIVVVANPYLGC